MLLALAACSSRQDYLYADEHRLGVDTTWYGSDLRIFHSALLYPRGEELQAPGYLVGVENIHPADRSFVARIADQRPWRESHLITHVMRYRLDPRNTTAAPCAVYSIIDNPDRNPDPGSRLFEHCRDAERAVPGNLVDASNAQGTAIARLRDDLTGALARGKVTHVLVMVMGWNTDQERAIKNFNSILGHLADEASLRKAPFRPLVIGVTWPSLWQLGDWSSLPAGLVRLVSFGPKRRDANDLGRYVLRDLVLEGVLPARAAALGDGPEVVLIGHSFGARALVRALRHDARADARFRPGDRMILLQGAFDVGDLFDDGILRPAFAAAAPRVTMTASAHDSAVTTAFWRWYAGSLRTYDELCRGSGQQRSTKLGLDLSPIACVQIERGGQASYGNSLCDPADGSARPTEPLPPHPPTAGAVLRYVDATRLVNCHAPLTGGGAHSDIFRRETARFLLDEMR